MLHKQPPAWHARITVHEMTVMIASSINAAVDRKCDLQQDCTLPLVHGNPLDFPSGTEVNTIFRDTALRVLGMANDARDEWLSLFLISN